MAIFSLNHSFIGRSTQPPGSASLYARYITRDESCTATLGARMPVTRGELMAWLDAQERDDRKNARVIDKIIIALPLELAPTQRLELLQAYGERLTEGRASWMAAIHDGPEDANNPHAHMIFRDRDRETGKRVMLTTEKGSTQRFRDGWEQEANLALERAGRPERIDNRTLAAQGIEREPQIHVGAGAMALAEKQHEFRSSEQEISRRVHGTNAPVTINYPVIDEGKTRFQENEDRKARNLEREAELARLGEYPIRPDAHPMDRVVHSAIRLEKTYARLRLSGEMPTDDGDPISTTIREHLGEAVRAQPQKKYEPAERHAGDTIQILGSDSPDLIAEHQQRAAEDRKDRAIRNEKLKEIPGMGDTLRGRDYLNALPSERGEAPPSDRDLSRQHGDKLAARPEDGERKPEEGKDPGERGPRKNIGTLLIGTGLGIAGRLAESLWSFFDPPRFPGVHPNTRSPNEDEDRQAKARRSALVRPPPSPERKEQVMPDDKNRAQQTVDQQKQREEAEAAHWRRAGLQAYLEQRNRERNHDRGR